jgi:hypothetical protein
MRNAASTRTIDVEDGTVYFVNQGQRHGLMWCPFWRIRTMTRIIVRRRESLDGLSGNALSGT